MSRLENRMDRRAFLGTAGVSALALASGTRPGTAATGTGEDFSYEITRTEAEWRERLSEEEFRVLRKGETELPGTSPLADDMRDGEFHCRGCDLNVYTSRWRAPVDKGWVFFAHAVPNSVLTGIDGPQEVYGMGDDWPSLIESHCRRCGSHLGHILLVEGEVLHCINGTALDFVPSQV
jgi:peptide-methionine (R)-S-oxide reductase